MTKSGLRILSYSSLHKHLTCQYSESLSLLCELWMGWMAFPCFQPRQRISHSTSLLLPHFCRIVAWAILVVDTNSYNFTMQSEVHLSCQGRSLPLSSSPPYVSPHCLPHSAGSLPGEGKCSSQGILTSGPGCTVPIRYKR